MAIGPDRIQVIKRESSALGGDAADDVDYLTPVDAQEDALESAGLYLQDAGVRDELVYIARDGDDMILRDQKNPTPRTLSELVSNWRRHFLLMGA